MGLPVRRAIPAGNRLATPRRTTRRVSCFLSLKWERRARIPGAVRSWASPVLARNNPFTSLTIKTITTTGSLSTVQYLSSAAAFLPDLSTESSLPVTAPSRLLLCQRPLWVAVQLLESQFHRGRSKCGRPQSRCPLYRHLYVPTARVPIESLAVTTTVVEDGESDAKDLARITNDGSKLSTAKRVVVGNTPASTIPIQRVS